MRSQTTLFDGDPDRHLVDAFWKFHHANPRVYKLFNRFALEAAATGRDNLGARLIWERMRWYTTVETQSQDEYKLNDHHPPYYARLWMQKNPVHAGFFRTRKVQREI